MYATIDTMPAEMSIGNDDISTNHPLGLIANKTSSPPVRRLAGTRCDPMSLWGVVSTGVMALASLVSRGIFTNGYPNDQIKIVQQEGQTILTRHARSLAVK